MSLLLWVHKVYHEFPNGRVVQGIYSMYEWTSGVILSCPPRYLIYISWKLINWDMMTTPREEEEDEREPLNWSVSY